MLFKVALAIFLTLYGVAFFHLVVPPQVIEFFALVAAVGLIFEFPWFGNRVA